MKPSDSQSVAKFSGRQGAKAKPPKAIDDRAYASGYYGYTEGEWQIGAGEDGTTGTYLVQRLKRRPTLPGARTRHGGRWSEDSARYSEVQCETCGQRRIVWTADLRRGQRVRFCSRKCRVTEVPACKTALMQAMRYHFGMRVKVIAQLLGVPSQAVSSATVSSSNIELLTWADRKFKTEAIEAARRVINGS